MVEMKLTKEFLFLAFVLSALAFIAGACGAPIFRNQVELTTEQLEALEPHVARWSTMAPNDSRDERRLIASQFEDILAIGYYLRLRSSDTYIMDIILDVFADWSHGYFYTPDGSLLESSPILTVQRIDEHWYKYNRYQ